MRKYNFDEVINRRGTSSTKWNRSVGQNELPMWVADMDFKTAPEISNALSKVALQGIYGYAYVENSWYEAYQNWWQKRHKFDIKKEWFCFATGIIPALGAAIRALTKEGENVLVQTPCYQGFFGCIKSNSRAIKENPLIIKDDSYEIDWVDFELGLSDKNTTMMILCNPHNPVGKIFTTNELSRIGELCKKHDVIILADEIHCDITEPGLRYTPFASVDEICADISVSFVSPTKAFNLAGVKTAGVFAKNKILMDKVKHAMDIAEISEPNVFATTAARTAFNDGEAWLDELNLYLSENKKIVARFLSQNLPSVKLYRCDATYLLWLEFKGVKAEQGIVKFIREKTGLYLSDGVQFRAKDGAFARMNIACPKITLIDGLNRLKQGVDEFFKIYKTFLVKRHQG